MAHRYTLEKYKGPASRYTCPSCGYKRQFTRYIDTVTNEHLSPLAGMCNRANSCGYHYTPKQFFAENPVYRSQNQKPIHRNPNSRSPIPNPMKTNIPADIHEVTLGNYHVNSFVQFLCKQFKTETVNRLIATYKLGTCKSPVYWNTNIGHCVVFWFTNKAQEVRYGQVKLFYDNGHTAKYVAAHDDDALRSCTTGIHYVLKTVYKKLQREMPRWLTNYEQQDKYMDCFFGEHLLATENKPVAIVEAPKTAIIASVYLPHLTWLAVGSLSYLTAERCEVLKGREVRLYPDLGAFDKWMAKANTIPGIEFKVSYFLEKRLPVMERIQGMDIADYLLGQK